MKVETSSESSERGSALSLAKNCKPPFPGFRIVTYDFELSQSTEKGLVQFAWSGTIGKQERLIVYGRTSC